MLLSLQAGSWPDGVVVLRAAPAGFCLHRSLGLLALVSTAVPQHTQHHKHISGATGSRNYPGV
jgi:hypothetical protein